MNTCENCQQLKPVYSFSRPCCLTRFLLRLPSRQIRRQWLERIREKYPSLAEVVEQAVIDQWENRKNNGNLNGK